MKKLLLIFMILFLFPATAVAQISEPKAKEFNIWLTLSDKNISLLTDDDVKSYIALPEEERIIVECDSAFALMLKWYKTAVYQVTAFNAEEKTIYNTKYDNNILNQYILLNDAVKIEIVLPSGGKLSDIIFFDKGGKADNTQIWEEPYEKADILVIAAHPDDEYLYMGGTIPYYGTERGLHVIVAWMSHQKRLRQDEALAALWAMGVHHYPVFVGFPDKYSRTYAKGARNWGEEATLSAIVDLYRKYRPEVVITHDLKGEYGHGAHMVTAAMALKAAEAAADEAQFPESAEEYGTWQIKKLYLHLYKKNKITMDWKQPLMSFGGKTPLEMAKLGYSYHKSQHIYGFHVSDASRYSCAKFGLAFTTVGLDVEKKDFLENVPAACLSDYVAPEPKPTIKPTYEPSIQTPEKVIQLTPDSTPIYTPDPAKQTASESIVNSMNSVIIVAAAMLIGSSILVLFIMLKRKNRS